MTAFNEDIKVQDRVQASLRRGDDRDSGWKGGGAPPIRVYQNVDVTLREEPDGPVVKRRKKHNIFLNYGREWIAELISLAAGGYKFRDDRVAYIGFGVGGTRQQIDSDVMRSTTSGGYGYTGYPDDWGSPSGTSGSGSGDPTQDDSDPTITGIEYPVEVASSDYYDLLAQPVTFPAIGIARFTAVLGYTELSFGAFNSVPISEVGLFTESVTDRTVAPLPGATVRYMIAYNTFDTLSKTSAYVLQVDWELRFS